VQAYEQPTWRPNNEVVSMGAWSGKAPATSAPQPCYQASSNAADPQLELDDKVLQEEAGIAGTLHGVTRTAQPTPEESNAHLQPAMQVVSPETPIVPNSGPDEHQDPASPAVNPAGTRANESLSEAALQMHDKSSTPLGSHREAEEPDLSHFRDVSDDGAGYDSSGGSWGITSEEADEWGFLVTPRSPSVTPGSHPVTPEHLQSAGRRSPSAQKGSPGKHQEVNGLDRRSQSAGGDEQGQERAAEGVVTTPGAQVQHSQQPRSHPSTGTAQHRRSLSSSSSSHESYGSWGIEPEAVPAQPPQATDSAAFTGASQGAERKGEQGLDPVDEFLGVRPPGWEETHRMRDPLEVAASVPPITFTPVPVWLTQQLDAGPPRYKVGGWVGGIAHCPDAVPPRTVRAISGVLYQQKCFNHQLMGLEYCLEYCSELLCVL
jgi:hypothetical protein